VRFHATIRLSGKTATGIPVPEQVIADLGGGKRPAVRVAIGDYAYRSTVGVMDGEYMIPLSSEHRAASGVEAGDEVEVDIEVDTQPREVTVPPDFAAALEGDAAAGRFFEGLSYSDKRWHVLSIEGAKSDETRHRRIEKSLGMLREGRAR
jgi:bacteriocin resistance YdeI/OmpD-like protein/uncharacterized protein DUF1905